MSWCLWESQKCFLKSDSSENKSSDWVLCKIWILQISVMCLRFSVASAVIPHCCSFTLHFIRSWRISSLRSAGGDWMNRWVSLPPPSFSSRKVCKKFFKRKPECALARCHQYLEKGNYCLILRWESCWDEPWSVLCCVWKEMWMFRLEG